jgi:EXLDI family protein
MEEFLLDRSGMAPVRFQGEQVAHSSGHHTSKENSRYHEVTVYRTSGGNWVVHVEYHTHWQGETGHSEVTVCENAEEAALTLDSVFPQEHVEGFPPTEHYAEKQARLENRIQKQWDAVASDVYRQLVDAGHVSFAETIE